MRPEMERAAISLRLPGGYPKQNEARIEARRNLEKRAAIFGCR
jgi:hypothetical protein